MARARNIKPGLFKNEILGESDPFLTILFCGLWCLADKQGRLEDRPKRIKAEIFPYRENLDINRYLTELSQLGFILRYQVDELSIIQVKNFDIHQHPHHSEKDSVLPEYSEGCVLTVNSPLNTGYNPSDSLNTDSLNTDSLNTDSMKNVKHIPKKINKKDNLLDGIDEQIAKDFTLLRKQKKAPITKTAIDGIQREADKAGISLEQALYECCKRGWQGFKAEWYNNSTLNNNVQQNAKFDAVEYINRDRIRRNGE